MALSWNEIKDRAIRFSKERENECYKNSVRLLQQAARAVDLCYRPQPFLSETKRIEFLFELYDKYTAGMFREEKRRKT